MNCRPSAALWRDAAASRFSRMDRRAWTPVRPPNRGDPMKYKQLGRTGLFVSEICLGTMTFGGSEEAGMWRAIGSLQQSEVDAIVGRALDAGVNFIDTADVYSFGESERLLGQALKNLG